MKTGKKETVPNWKQWIVVYPMPISNRKAVTKFYNDPFSKKERIEFGINAFAE